MSAELTIREALERAASQLTPGSATARLDAEVLLSKALGVPRHQPYAFPERKLTPETADRYRALIEGRAKGEPVAYLIGEQEFWSLSLQVTPATLIPRPETERLVELALELIPPDAAWRIADLGTGSGAIALAIASERPRCRVVATDISTEALAVARNNAERLSLEAIEFRNGDWFKGLDDKLFELVVCNPPYVAENDPHLSRGDVRFEPAGALVSIDNGLGAIRHICEGSGGVLLEGGCLILEHGFNQGPAVRELMSTSGYTEIRQFQDYSGHDRVTRGRIPTQ